MKIQCTLLRKGGTHVEIGRKKYHFAPDANGLHVSDVEDEDHIARFLGIPEAYRVVVEKAAVKEPAPAPTPDEEQEQEPADNGLEELDKIALTKRYIELYNEPPSGSLTKPRLIEAIREKAARQ